ncbi:hypothetical protein EV356DRAFT_521580 [Viridothelium virens]|uniref:Zn(2)-C6 fungal-type domain-containing protein n=1 Tax=Viridothelium virens TaxID=1048519 RepID=A0A6A6GTY5_VIRVR|nr:hypothetical protein EV356DRAFT_521580 [Viridothelium virens]
MSSDILTSPVPPPGLTRLSISSTSQPSSSSSESPLTTPSFGNPLRFSSDGGSDEEPEIVPKVEELEENGIPIPKIEPSSEDNTISPSPITPRRGRGRPRKHPPVTTTAAKGRSKTGCFTCRKRKKKCDEAKPSCNHCLKNNVVCEGYPPKAYWRSGKQRRASFALDPPAELPLLIDGVETETDRIFLDHFNINVSRVLTVLNDDGNPFRTILLPMALRHAGLMHSVLCLAGSHLVERHPGNYDYVERQAHHFGQACRKLRMDEAMAANMAGESDMIIEDPVIASTVVLCLDTVVNGDLHGQYRYHMDSAEAIINRQRKDPRHMSRNVDFQMFLHEFFNYHNIANSITNYQRRNVFMSEDFELPQFMIQPEAGALLGVMDGLFGILSRIRKIRDSVRQRKHAGYLPLVDYELLSDAQQIDVALRQWRCVHEKGTARHVASMLYRQTTWIYLRRTVLADQPPDQKVHEAVHDGLMYLRQLPGDDSTQSILLMPLFLLGCSAYKTEYRPEISEAFDRLQAYSEFGNIKYARQIVLRIWEMMDGGDEDVWDWETIISNMGWDFLIT